MAEKKVDLDVVEEKTVEAPVVKKGKAKKGAGRRRRKAKAASGKAAREGKAPVKIAKRGKKGRKGRRVKRAAPKAAAPAPAEYPAVGLMSQGQAADPIWWRYAQAPQLPPSRRPSIPTDIKVGNHVGWITESSRERVGVVTAFREDAALIDSGTRVESIRISRLTVIPIKEKKKKGK